eukprot:TRINITY_DN21504_c0_g1_i5.p1 TRINITY_DN21504_c0_g1~~TRINITY_DN21504_c0_g1_i5.p1  ORF type:complete len:445 (-),score=63.42 TRINITY_DN21504_c0_g1_i5:376-1677(-)
MTFNETGIEVEGDEDWRYGPLGRAGTLRSAEAPPQATPKAAPQAEATTSVAEPPRSLTGEIRPRTIWAYWAQGYSQMPEFFKMCVATWQRLNPHWDVRILQKSTILEYLSELELPNRFMDMTSHQTASDAVRLGVLSRYGGIWLDVNIVLCGSLDELCWNAISSGQTSACVFYHPFYGTEALGGEDFVESWFLAAKPNNPFFIRWRDVFRELFHDRLDIHGLLQHHMYQGLDLSGFERLNQEFSGSGMEFREYLAIHAMCHRLLETDAQAHTYWRDHIFKVNVLLLDDPRADQLIEGVPFIKLRTPDYSPLLALTKEQLADRRHLLGRLLDPPDMAVTPQKVQAPAAPAFGSRAAASAMRPAGGRNMFVAAGFATASIASLCRGNAQPGWRRPRLASRGERYRKPSLPQRASFPQPWCAFRLGRSAVRMPRIF